MPGPFEVHVKGARAIACESHSEAEYWASLLGTDYAPATVHELSEDLDPRQLDMLALLEGDPS